MSLRWLAAATLTLVGCESSSQPNQQQEEPATLDAATRDARVRDAAKPPSDEPDPPEVEVERPADSSVADARRPDARQPDVLDATVEDAGEPPAPSDSFADKTLVPHASWTCGMPQGIPAPGDAPEVFTASFSILAEHELGLTPIGTRTLNELGAGDVTGAKVKAALQPGGFELSVVLANGAVELEQVVMLKTGDGRFLYLRVCGTAPHGDEPTRVVMDFEAPNGSAYAFLNDAKLVGTREKVGDKINLRVHDVQGVGAGASLTIENPPGVVEQTWDCKQDTGSAGEEIYRETVKIGSSQSVGQSKRGNRNVIPITGGTTTGRLAGTVLAHGADFQLIGSSFVLDARYTVRTKDNELILVRNCGPASALIPVFETRSDGPYAFINENDWVSSSPSVGIGTVSLVISKKR